jgi:DNA-binding GntR family transcriptional regulator
MHLDKQHPVPVYVQLKEMLRNQIERGVYFSHQKLPSERNLCQHFNLSRMTARRALQELIDDGFAYTKVGKGTFVSENPLIKGDVGLEAGAVSSALIDTITEERYQTKLIEYLLMFNTARVERTINEILATYSLEVLALRFFPQIICHLEQRWQRGEINLLTQNYAVTTLRSQLTAMSNATPLMQTGPKALLACAPGDRHEIGLLLTSLSLRRRGFTVIYLGPDVALTDFRQLLEGVRPKLVCFSAATRQAAQALAAFSHELYQHPLVRVTETRAEADTTLFTFGGVAFTQDPQLIGDVSGLYLGSTIEMALSKIEQLFQI